MVVNWPRVAVQVCGSAGDWGMDGSYFRFAGSVVVFINVLE